ncbi:MAG TPA: GNAT family N-acetyltransferase [Cyclobacteriaceae bacterium]
MSDPYKVVNSELTDLKQIFDLFDQSIIYQEKHGYPSWRNYDQRAVVRDVESRNSYKIVADSKTAIVFSVCYTDKIIWREHDKGESIYLHRIVVNPEFKGQKLFGKILEWTIKHGREKGCKNIRMDTWSANPAIMKYYEGFGFRFIENYTTPDTEELPVHNRKLALSLLEYAL